MAVLRLSTGFGEMSDALLETTTNSIISSIDNNPNFPEPALMPDLKESRTLFSEALAIAREGSLLDKAIKNQRRVELIDLLHLMGNYVLFTSEGDELIARSSGMPIVKVPGTAPLVGPAENQTLQDGANSGELKLGFKRVPAAKSYLYQITADPLTEQSVWKSEMGTVRRHLFTGLQSGKKYWCRVVAVGINGQAVYSEPVSRIAQ